MPFSNPVEPLAVQEANALAIAAAIQAAGISLLGAPVLLYQTTSAPAGAGLLGSTVENDDPPGTTYLAAAQFFDSSVGYTMAQAFQKIFYNEGLFQIPSSGTDGVHMTTLAAVGCKFLISMKPNRAGFSGAGDPTGSYGDANTVAQQTAMANNIAIWQTAIGAVFDVDLWHEPSDGWFPSATAYHQYVAFYGPVVCNPAAYWNASQCPPGTSAPVPVNLVYCGAASNTAVAISYYPGDGAGYTHYSIAVDLYSHTYVDPSTGVIIAPGILDQVQPGATQSYMSLADNATPPKPFGLGEWGNGPMSTLNPYWDEFIDYLINVFSARLAAGKSNYPIIYFDHANANTVEGPTDAKVPGIQAMYQALSSGTTATTIPAGTTVTVTPLDPSAGGQFAAAAQLSYDIAITSLVSLGTSTNPFLTATLKWFDTDSSTANAIKQQTWSMPIGKSGTAGTNITGEGPQHGQWWSLTLANLDTVTCTLELSANGNSRTVDRDNWKWDAPGSVAVNGYTRPAGAAHGNSLGAVIKPTIAAGGTASYILSLFSGQVWVSFAQYGATTPGEIEMIIQPLPSSFWGAATLLDVFGTYDGILIFPRAPCLVTFNNNQSSGSVQVGFEAIAYD